MSRAIYNNAGPNAPSVDLIAGPEFRDDFSTDGNLNGRTGWTVETRPTFSGQVNAISASGGKAGGTTGSAAFALHTASVETARVQFKIGAYGAALHHHVNIAAVDAERDWLNINVATQVSSGLQTGTITFAKVVNGASASNIAILQQWRTELGDTLESDFTEVAGVKYWTCYLNGQQAGAPVDITSWGGAFTKKHGIIGNIASSTDSFQIVDPATQVALRLYMPNRTIYRNANGSVTWFVKAYYTGPDPSGLYATVYDLSSGSEVAVSGLTDVALSSFAAAGGTATGTLSGTSSQVSSGGPFFVRVTRKRLSALIGNATCVVDGPYQTVGETDLANGQSLAVAAFSQTATTATYAQPSNCWHLEGVPTNGTTLGDAWNRRLRPISGNTTAAALANVVKTVSSVNLTVASGGVSGTAIAVRGAGSVCQQALKQSIDRAGGRVHFVHHVDGQSDVTTAQASYIAAIQAIYDDLDAYNGAAIKVLMHPLASCWKNSTGNDEQWQAVRRMQWQLTQDYPSRYFLGAYTLDCQHFDSLHFNDAGYATMLTRAGWARAKARGDVANDRNGPSLYSVTRVDAQTVYCVYDLNGADSLELANTAYASEYHGGMSFSTAATKSGGTIATKLYPTGATVDASPAGGRQGITFTFAANTFPGTVYAWAAYGKNPFNPNDNNTNTDPINLDMANKASMIRGVYSDGMKVALRPRFTTDSLDYLSAS
ncbi:hypothetical protein Saro_2988 [Novosphingobium aromaticivorans DSM 12444]|uniref:Sialate O-acetylesterase domain-containing protein n=1 Tax=Novosphingobium aromaticivorans (strain ATCC 700278 / DSM 12444 / CCUG 56034 / CIP 105152 / NBRC 16084 / F199) TaxID=279238 RepID=Q2G400_NOVAD|nr:hypothetical protein [Novosphingobium aromaticivorans]ABD27423.1 hypothetical protein Saro_2988 [Novosphingobium aromaticivorans DSM 12444]SCY69068.1 hypothetical protein SAMN05660666_02491 [Novosphingobium aromaticivorans]